MSLEYHKLNRRLTNSYETNNDGNYRHGTILDVLPQLLVEDYFKQGLFVMQTYGKGEMIHQEGELCRQVEIILFGEVVIERIGLTGDLMTLNYFRYGDILGSNLIFSSAERYPMTITAKQITKVVVIQEAVLLSLCQEYPDFLMQFIKIISDLSVILGKKMKNRVSRTIRQSLITYLKHQYTLQGNESIQMTMSKKALSEMFGVSRTSVSRELQKMRDEGVIAFDTKTIQILDLSILNEIG